MIVVPDTKANTMNQADLLIGIEKGIPNGEVKMLVLKKRECDDCKGFATTWGDTMIIEDLIDDETDDKINAEPGEIID